MSAIVDFPVKPEARPYLDAARENADEPDWLASRRQRALARFAEQGFPSRRGEAWRYLDLRPLEQAPLPPAGTEQSQQGAAAGALLLAEIGLAPSASRLVFVDGCVSPILSARGGLPAGVWLGSTTAAIATKPELVETALDALTHDPDQPFAALNAALFTDGFVLEVAPGVVLEEPIEIVHLASGEAAASLHTRSLVTLGARSRVQLIEIFAGGSRYWRNEVMAVQLAAGAALDRVALIEEADEAVHLGALDASLGAAARFTSFDLLLGGGATRREAIVRSAGEGAHCGLYGAFLASRRQQANIVTTVEHHGRARRDPRDFQGRGGWACARRVSGPDHGPPRARKRSMPTC